MKVIDPATLAGTRVRARYCGARRQATSIAPASAGCLQVASRLRHSRLAQALDYPLPRFDIAGIGLPGGVLNSERLPPRDRLERPG